MNRDIRDTDIWRQIEEHFRRVHEPAFGKISGAMEPCASPDGRHVAFTGTTLERLEGHALSRICIADVADGSHATVTAGPYEDRLPRWSPDGRRLAFLSDRAERGVHQLHLLDADRIGEAVAAPVVDGIVEYHWWSPDGSQILLGVAGRGADLAGGQGSGTLPGRAEELPDWMPTIETAASEDAWRSLWLYDAASATVRRLSREGLNVWEASWCSDDAVAAIISEKPGEEAWYEAPLALIDVATGSERVLYRSKDQLGWPAATPSGARLAVVEAVCSDRWIVAGDVLLIDVATGEVQRLDMLSVDVTQLLWRDEERLFFIGVRGLTTVAGDFDVTEGKAHESWTSAESCGLRYPEASPVGDTAFACILESYARYPEIAIVEDGESRTVASLGHDGGAYLRAVGGAAQEVAWRAPDGLEIQGLLITPSGPAPHPLVVLVHGGPVWAYRNKWGMMYPIVPLLLSRGYAVLLPNPRGSSGRGQEFARLVYGDMGGDDTNDYLSGVDALVERGIADPKRLGVTGGSYGGFMTSWLVTQTDRFAAAVAQAPVTDWYSQHLTSNIPHFDKIFLDADPYAPGGRYYERSPVMFASRVKTPVLHTTGALDRCTPPTQAVEFHRALVEHGVESELAIYPGEGHGVRNFPALIDQSARIVAWFERYMPA